MFGWRIEPTRSLLQSDNFQTRSLCSSALTRVCGNESVGFPCQCTGNLNRIGRAEWIRFQESNAMQDHVVNDLDYRGICKIRLQGNSCGRILRGGQEPLSATPAKAGNDFR